MSDDPNLPLLEEVKLNSNKHPDFVPKLTRSASEGSMLSGLNPPPPDEYIVPTNIYTAEAAALTSGNNSNLEERRVRAVQICNELLRMGFPQKSVFALLSYVEVPDAQSAVDLLVKSDFGWTHTFAPDPTDEAVCEVCQDHYEHHIEAVGGAEDIGHPQKLDLFEFKDDVDETQLDKIRTDIPCKVCMRGIPFGQMFHLSCGHMYCKNCVRGFLEVNINSGAVMELKCPEEDCEARFTKVDVERLCKKSTYDKYIRFRENIEVSQNKKLRWCPAPNCGRFVEKKTRNPHVVCECGFHMCFGCGEAWHSGESCAKNYERLYSKWASHKKIQRCPHCKIRIEKNEGCNHMTCSFCHYQWCWICGGRYSSSHFDSVFFGCPMLQFTSTDWSMKKIALYHFFMFIISPLLCIYNSFNFVGRPMCNFMEDRYSCKCLLGVIVGLTIIAVVPFVTIVMMVPVILYRFYNLFNVVVRAVAN